MQEFKQYYRSFSAWRWHWDTAVLPVVPPSVLLSAVASVPRIESAGQRLESPGTPPLKLRDAEEEDLEEAATRKPWMGNLASSSYSPSTRNNNAHLDTIAEDMVRTKEIKCEERNRAGGGSYVGGLYRPDDYGMNPRRTKGKRQSSRFFTIRMVV